MSAALAPATRARLAKLLGLLGSDHAGERDNAARAAHRLVIQSGTSWEAVIAAGVSAKAARNQQAPPQPWRATVAACLRQPGALKVWERDFLQSLSRFPRLSEKQRACLKVIAARVLENDA